MNLSDDDLRAMQKRVFDRIEPTLRSFARFLLMFIVAYVACGFFGDPTGFTKNSYWLQLVLLIVPLAIYASYGMYSKKPLSGH